MHFVNERVAQFRDQASRRLSGELTEDEFRPLRLMNGLYLQLHAYMLRIAIPYGTLSVAPAATRSPISPRNGTAATAISPRGRTSSSTGSSSRTRPTSSSALADVEMHAIQTSGNCIRNVTTDQWAGAAADELADPRPVAELIRQWSSLHPEFSYPAAQVQDRRDRRAA